MTWAHCARCQGGSWWCSTAGRPRRHEATSRAAGRFNGIVQRFSTTTRSTPSRASSTSAAVGGVVASMARPGTSTSTGPSPATVRTVQPRSAKTAAHVVGDDRHAVVTTQPERDEGDGGHAGNLPTASALASDARRLLEGAWRADDAGGFCVPHAMTYPWQWLWDSCFHAVVWAHLGDDRAAAELRSALSAQDADGFVPHLRYGPGPSPHGALWGRDGTSTITQPPMYGHALAELARQGLAVDDELVGRAEHGLRFLLHERRRSSAGLVELCHPWESGCDDSPRWDDAVPRGWTPPAWFDRKGELVAGIERTAGGAPLHNPAFAVGSVGFSALVAWNAQRAGVGHGLGGPPGRRPPSWPRPSTPGGTRSAAPGSTTGRSPPGRVRSAPPTGCSPSWSRPAPPPSRSSSTRRPSAPPSGRVASIGTSRPTRPRPTGAARRGRRSPTCCGGRRRARERSMRRRRCRGRWWRVRWRRGTPSTGRPTPVERSAPSPRPGARWPWWSSA